MHKILFYNKFYFMPLHVSSTMCSSSGGQNCIIQPLMMRTWCSKHVEAWNKTYCKTKSCASSWLITKINILRCTVSKTLKKAYFRQGLVHVVTKYGQTNRYCRILKKKKTYIKVLFWNMGANSQQRQESNGSIIRKTFKKVTLTITMHVDVK